MDKTMINTTAIVLAAGQGTRMKSKHPKVLHQIMGRPMVTYLLDTLMALGLHDILVVVGYEADKVKEALKEFPVRFVVQEPQKGTGHAVQTAMAAVPQGVKEVLVLCGDAPLVSGESIQALHQAHLEAKAPVTIQTAVLPDGLHYGRVVRDNQGRVVKVVQSRDADPETLKIPEINTGTYFFQGDFLREHLKRLTPDNVQQEFYLTDLVHLAVAAGQPVAAVGEDDWETVLGINSRQELAAAGQWLRRRINDRHMAAGVTLIDPESTYIESAVTIGRDTVIYPDCYLMGRTQIGENCLLEPQVKIADSWLGDAVTVRMCSVITESRLGKGVVVGPFAHIRPQSELREGVKIGNFVEVKKSTLHPGVKANHLTYLGDAVVGPGVNVGAGTITCNYDGVKKHPTFIEEGAFIGANAALVAPVTIGAGAYVGAGSTITEDVPPGKLAIARGRQVIKERKPGKKGLLSDTELLTPANLYRALNELRLPCPPDSISELLKLLLRRSLHTVGAFRQVASPANLELIKQMYRHAEGRDPRPDEVVANLANLAGAGGP
jgi:bifunctional UDP-N-acetylglucosamine pyrophosphorylase/glucosamine-1-phosphate N-acetyltransferase